MTMLGRGEIQAYLRKMVEAGCKYAVIETSSEGVLQYRHFGLLYDIAVFTNLGREHIERHGGFENLKKDKGRIFRALSGHKTKVINGAKVQSIILANTDDQSSDYYLSFEAERKIGFGLKDCGVFAKECCEAKILNSDISGVSFTVNNSNYKIKIPGEFNIYNALPAISLGKIFGMSDENIQNGLDSVKIVAGRMEFVKLGQPFYVVVDYAHEPISLRELFSSLRKFTDKKIIGVIGSDGGGRDKSKRIKMGEVSAELCDTVIVTDVNCYDENPIKIADMLAEGARNIGKKDGVDLFVEIDRRKAIEKAVSLAQNGDTVAITAKGTEPCIAIAKGVNIPWDDRQVAKESLNKIGYAG
jgi:UDP-N-acetylmuramoyl-L-alanyl-D-glutamate--2,6-diaminopimelate ligase